PGGVAGGLQWGSSTDGKNIYVAAANSLHQPWVVNGVTITTAFWEALDAGTGAVVWQTADPAGGLDSAPVASINGVVFGCSLDPHGNMYAMDSSNGHILWSHASGGSCLSGAAIAGGNIYWGSGYSNFGSGTGNNQFFAFSVK
ncbi:MAG: polyvinylalcohol dehydrogenase, partial [Chloroflexota bacterium]